MADETSSGIRDPFAPSPDLQRQLRRRRWWGVALLVMLVATVSSRVARGQISLFGLAISLVVCTLIVGVMYGLYWDRRRSLGGRVMGAPTAGTAEESAYAALSTLDLAAVRRSVLLGPAVADVRWLIRRQYRSPSGPTGVLRLDDQYVRWHPEPFARTCRVESWRVAWERVVRVEVAGPSVFFTLTDGARIPISVFDDAEALRTALLRTPARERSVGSDTGRVQK